MPTTERTPTTEGGEALGPGQQVPAVARPPLVIYHHNSIAGHEVWAASLPHIMASDAGELMCQGEPFAAVYWDTAEHRQFSLRSRDGGLDVATIAQGYGGGGHRNAAGFRVTRDHELARV